MGKTVQRIVSTKFFHSGEGRLYQPGEVIQIDEDLLINKKRGTRTGPPGLEDDESVFEELTKAPSAEEKKRIRAKGKEIKDADKARETNPIPARPLINPDENPAIDLDIEEGGEPRGSSVLD